MRSRLTLILALCSSALALSAAVALPLGAQEGDADGEPASWRERAAAEEIDCNPQTPHDFLIRANWQVNRRMERDEIRDRRGVHQQAIRFRTERYGFFPGFGQASWNDRSPMQHARGLRLFDRPIRLNERVIPAARCAEREIATS